MVWLSFSRADHARHLPKYAKDATDVEWHFIVPFMPPQPARGRRCTIGLRSAVDALFRLLQYDCQGYRRISRAKPRFITDSSRFALTGHGRTCTIACTHKAAIWKGVKKAHLMRLLIASRQNPTPMPVIRSGLTRVRTNSRRAFHLSRRLR